jgi:hypothetical protein
MGLDAFPLRQRVRSTLRPLSPTQPDAGQKNRVQFIYDMNVLNVNDGRTATVDHHSTVRPTCCSEKFRGYLIHGTPGDLQVSIRTVVLLQD